MAEEPDIEPETAKKIFLEDVHKIAPQHLTENAFRYSTLIIHMRWCVRAVPVISEVDLWQ